MARAEALVAQRESAKRETRRRIEAAARAAFRELGYERANLREIAKRAGVATGTLFLYAKDKRDLLLWIINDDFEALTEPLMAELAKVRADRNLLEQLMLFFEPRYRYWVVDPDLALHALMEITIERDVREHTQNDARRHLVIEHLTETVRAQQRLGNVTPFESAEAIARLCLAVFNAALRLWLRSSPEPDVEEGLAELRLLLRLALQGVMLPSAGGAGERSG